MSTRDAFTHLISYTQQSITRAKISKTTFNDLNYYVFPHNNSDRGNELNKIAIEIK